MWKSLFLLGFCGMHIGLCVSARCPSGWIENDSICYFFSHDVATWDEAIGLCKGLASSKLAEPKTNSAAQFITSTAQAKHRHFWIGITDMIVEDQWIYPSDLTQILVSNWASNQPNQAAGANCVATWYQYLSKWADEPCTTKYNFICERTIIGGEEVIG